MTRQPVNSNMIKSIGYERGMLHVEFPKGSIYAYAGVTPDQHAAFLGAISIGKHFLLHIKPHFAGKKLAEAR